ncbi:unnamed protein product, partial [Cladocopium goreaui]
MQLVAVGASTPQLLRTLAPRGCSSHRQHCQRNSHAASVLAIGACVSAACREQRLRLQKRNAVEDWPAGAGASVEDCGMVSMQGADPDRPKVNQDACYVAELPNGSLQAVVLDGHGKKGHVVSGALKAFLPDLIEEQLAQLANACSGDIGSALCEAFRATDSVLRQNRVGQVARASGAAALAAIVERGNKWTVHVACAGDCHSWLLEKVEGRWLGSSISQPSSCQRERERLEAAGGRVSDGVLWAGPIGVAMSRALGDLALRPFGLLSEPETWTISGGSESFLILVSDGVSDVLSPQQCADLFDAEEPQSLAEDLAEAAREGWQAGLPMDVRID